MHYLLQIWGLVLYMYKAKLFPQKTTTLSMQDLTCYKCLYKTLFNIVVNRFKNCWTVMSVLYNDVQILPLNSQEYKSFEIYAVSIKISMTE